MKILRTVVPSLLLAAVISSGCILTSAQILATFKLTNPFTIVSASNLAGVDIDLTTIGDYNDNKDKLKDIADLALLGEFKNVGLTDVDVEVWITPDFSTHTTAATVTGDATALRVWGPFKLNAGQTTRIGWDESAKLFSAAGKAAIISEVKGDGKFTLYAIGAAGTYSFEVKDGAFVVVLDAGL